MFHGAPAPQMLLLLLSWLCPFSRWTPEDHPVPFPFREYSGICSIIFIISYSAPVFIPFPHRLSYNTLTRAIFPCKTRQFLLCYSGILTKLQRRTKAMDRHSSYTAPRSDRSPASRGSRRSPKPAITAVPEMKTGSFTIFYGMCCRLLFSIFFCSFW